MGEPGSWLVVDGKMAFVPKPPPPLLVAFGHRAGVGRSVAAGSMFGRGRLMVARFDDGARWRAIEEDPGVETCPLGDLVRRDGWNETLRRSRPAREWLRMCIEQDRLDDEEPWLWNAATVVGVDVEHHGRSAAFTDLRFPDEAEFIRAESGLLVRIDRPGVEPSGEPFDEALADWTDWDHVLVNDSTREALGLAVRAVVEGDWGENLPVGPDDLEPGAPVPASLFERRTAAGRPLAWYSSVVVDGPCGDCSAHHELEVDVDDEGGDWERNYTECMDCGKRLWVRVHPDGNGEPEARGLYGSWNPSATGVPR